MCLREEEREGEREREAIRENPGVKETLLVGDIRIEENS